MAIKLTPPRTALDRWLKDGTRNFIDWLSAPDTELSHQDRKQLGTIIREILNAKNTKNPDRSAIPARVRRGAVSVSKLLQIENQYNIVKSASLQVRKAIETDPQLRAQVEKELGRPISADFKFMTKREWYDLHSAKYGYANGASLKEAIQRAKRKRRDK
ncbi:hypothetical protein ACFOOP_10235 [Marinicaulis aureus]|uniref:DUF1018 domain-containing protein n=1 Tax=Hyphococcus aureus TaxID=2666033 RepID=A0ABW1L0A8_9PROT